jgi:hypothetical protein
MNRKVTLTRGRKLKRMLVHGHIGISGNGLSADDCTM